jgi:hypothetical protein
MVFRMGNPLPPVSAQAGDSLGQFAHSFPVVLPVTLFDPNSLLGLVEANPGPPTRSNIEDLLKRLQSSLGVAFEKYQDAMAAEVYDKTTVDGLKRDYTELVTEIQSTKAVLSALQASAPVAAAPTKRDIPTEELPVYQPGRDVHDFFESFELALRSYPHIDQDAYHLHLLRAVRRGGEPSKPVAAWISSALFDIDNWQDRKKAFLERYGGTAAQLRALDQVVHFAYKNTESAQVFVDRFVHLCNAASIADDDRLAIAIFRLALPPPLQLEMGRVFQDQWPDSLEEVLHKLITVATYSNFRSYTKPEYKGRNDYKQETEDGKSNAVSKAAPESGSSSQEKRPPLPSILQDTPSESGKLACGICRMTSHGWRTCTVDRGDSRVAAIRQKFKLPAPPAPAGAHLPTTTTTLRRVQRTVLESNHAEPPAAADNQ